MCQLIIKNTQEQLTMRVGFLFGVLLICTQVKADLLDLQYLHDVRTNSYLLCASSMLYFNPTEKVQDPRALTGSFGSMTQLDTRVVQLGQPAQLAEIERLMSAEFKALDSTPRDKAQDYPARILTLLQLQSRLDTWGREQYQQAQQDAPLLLTTLHQQSLEMAQLLLDYQVRHYPLPASAPIVLTQAKREQLDQAISERFELLLTQHPGQAGELNRVRSSYRFVRTQLLGDEAFRAKGGADFYITRNIADLDEMAMQAVLNPTASR
jgi:hypothetical protein